MKLIKQTVYIPEKEKHDYGYFFTPEQLNQYTKEVIKQALETATEKAELQDKGGWNTDGTMYLSNMKLDKQSITNTAEETFKKFEV